jgi:hypothetical protein
MRQKRSHALLEGLDEDLKIIQRQTIELHDAGEHEERHSKAALLRVRVSVLEQRLEIARLVYGNRLGLAVRLISTAIASFAAGWIVRGWC